MTGDEVDRQVGRSRRRLEDLRRRVEREGAETDPLMGEAVEELSVALEELAATNEQLAEAQLASERHARRYLDLFRHAPDAYLVTDEQGVITAVNDMAERKLGRPECRLVGKPLLKEVAGSDRGAFLACLTALREGRVRVEDRLLRFGPEPGFHASVSAVPERREGDLEIRWMLRDVTERQRSEVALRASEARMRSLAQSLRVLIAYVDREERYLFANAAFEDWFGTPPGELLGTAIRELIPDETWRRARPYMDAVLEGKPQFFENELALESGDVRHTIVEYEPDIRDDGEVAGFYALIIDVSGLKRAEREARAAESRVRAVLDAALDGILAADADCAIRSVNPALCRMFGYAPQELLGADALALLGLAGGPEDRARLAPQVVGTVTELVGVRRDGARFPIQVSVGEVQGEPEGRHTFVVTVRDLSAQKHLESQLRAATEAAAVVEERERRRLAADLHDDVSQLLTLAGMKLGPLREAAGDTALAAELGEVTELVSRAHQRAESLTFQLSPPILHDVGLVAAAEWLAEEMRRSYGLRVEVEGDGEPVLGEAVRIALFRALRELLINVARHAGTPQAWVRFERADGQLRLRVDDSGKGFDPSGERSGYGLFSIRERMRHLEGHLEIESVPGDGTRITLVAPLDADTHG